MGWRATSPLRPSSGPSQREVETLARANGSAAQPDTAALPVVTWRDPVSSAPEGVAGIQSCYGGWGRADNVSPLPCNSLIEVSAASATAIRAVNVAHTLWCQSVNSRSLFASRS